jgi:hypothetical protein
MKFAALVVALLCALPQIATLRAQQGGEPDSKKAVNGNKADATPEAATKPIRFTKFPVPEATPLDADIAVERAVVRLLQLKEGDGDQWPYEGVYREDRGQLPVGYRVGGTAIVCLSLLAAKGYAGDAARQKAVAAGVGFVLKTLDEPRMSLEFIGNYDVRGWGHIYALQLFLSLEGAKAVPTECAATVEAKTKWLVKALCESAIPEAGGWNYSRRAGYESPRNTASTFMTAPALQALFLAKARGHAVDDRVIAQALAALERSRSAPGAYGYGAALKSQNDVEEERLTMMDKVGSSASRAALVETTLQLAGRGDAARLRRSVDWFFAHWDDLAVRKSQQGTHIQPFGIAPYYFLFGHVYAAQAIEMLPDGEDKDALRTRMRAFLARSMDQDGTWNDRQFDRSAGYGTAMAVLALRMPHLPKPAGYEAATVPTNTKAAK